MLTRRHLLSDKARYQSAQAANMMARSKFYFSRQLQPTRDTKGERSWNSEWIEHEFSQVVRLLINLLQKDVYSEKSIKLPWCALYVAFCFRANKSN